jgi:hypothetical protein
LIKRCTEPFELFINWINTKKLTDVECWITILPGYDTIGDPDSEQGCGFAVYCPEDATILVAGACTEGIKKIYKDRGEEISDEELYWQTLICIAHEYIHHLQNVAGNTTYNEEEADNGAYSLVNEFLNNEDN